MAAAAAAGKKFMLKSSDGEVFEVEEVVAMESQTIKDMIKFKDEAVAMESRAIKDDFVQGEISIKNVTGKILSKVIEYCKKHTESATDDFLPPTKIVGDKLKPWDKKFIKEVDMDTLFDLITAADYLNIRSLLDLSCEAVAGMMKGKSPAEIRTMFNIVNDYTEEEEKTLREEINWAFE